MPFGMISSLANFNPKKAGGGVVV